MKISELPVLADAKGNAYIPVVDPDETDPALQNKRIYLSTLSGEFANFAPYDPAEFYNSTEPSFVSYSSNVYEYIFPTPTAGNLPTDPAYWQLTSAGRFSHSQNTDTHTTSTSFEIGKQLVSLDEFGEPIDEPHMLIVLKMGKTAIRQFGEEGVFPNPPTFKLQYTNGYTGTGSDVWVDLGSGDGGDSYALQDGTILYHSAKWFTPTGTVSSSGTSVTSVGSQFTSGMVGAKLTISGESRIITGYTSSTVVTVASAYSTNHTAVAAGNWGVFSKAMEVMDFYGITTTLYSHQGAIVAQVDGHQFAIPNYRTTNNNMTLGDSGIVVGGSGKIAFTNNTTGANEVGGATDAAIKRAAAGVLEINNGTSGDYRDLLARNLAVYGIDATATINAVTLQENSVPLSTKYGIAYKTGTVVDFVAKETWFGAVSNDTTVTPLTGHITANLTGAKIGHAVVMPHNWGTEPTLTTSGVTFINKGGTYALGVTNMIYMVYAGSNTIHYSFR